MGLKDLKSDLTSLKYGNDRPNGGNSGQPFIKNPIIKDPGKLAQADSDSILRGGLRAPIRAAEDVARMAKYLFNTKSASGFLFITKQNILSRTAVATEASINGAYGNNFTKEVSQFPDIDTNIPKSLAWTRAPVNQGIYTPLSTLAQAGAGFLGVHVNALGLDPTGKIPTISILKYEDIIRGNDNLSHKGAKIKIPSPPPKPSYTPLSINPKVYQQERKIITNAYENRLVYLTLVHQYESPEGNKLFDYSGGPGSVLGVGKTTISFADKKTPGLSRTGINNVLALTKPEWFFNGGEKLHESNLDLAKLPVGDIGKTSTTSLNPNYVREGLDDELKLGGGDTSYVMNLNPSYNHSKRPIPEVRYDNLTTDKELLKRINEKSINFEERVDTGDAGATEGSRTQALDTTNASPIYTSRAPASGRGTYNDFVQLRIGAINPEKPNTVEYGHFRAFIDDFGDSYSGKWKGTNYMGRGESFYKYQSFDRNISLSFTVAATSQAEMEPMYKKLNWLASLTAPYYTQAGYMSGNLTRLTVGGYLYEQPGFFESVSYDISKDSPWEIGIGEGNTLKELPMIVRVKVKFTPIHMFRPEKYNESNKQQQYISLAGGPSSATLYDSRPSVNVSNS